MDEFNKVINWMVKYKGKSNDQKNDYSIVIHKNSKYDTFNIK